MISIQDYQVLILNIGLKNLQKEADITWGSKEIQMESYTY